MLTVAARMMTESKGLHAVQQVTRPTLLVDRELDDGRLVVINCSRKDIPVGLVFTSLFAEDVQIVSGEVRRNQVASMAPVELKLESVEWFRSVIDVVPLGHNAAVVLVGASLPVLRAQLAMRPKGRQIFIVRG
jgi:hypothetical protein